MREATQLLVALAGVSWAFALIGVQAWMVVSLWPSPPAYAGAFMLFATFLTVAYSLGKGK